MITTILAIKLFPTNFCFFFFPFRLKGLFFFKYKTNDQKNEFFKNLFTALNANIIS